MESYVVCRQRIFARESVDKLIMKNAKKKFALHLTIQILTVAALVIIGLSIGKPY